MRLFYLENETGSRKPLNYEAGIFLSNPDGLGFEFGGTFADIGNGFFKNAIKKYPQKVFSANLLFFGEPYKLYREFVDWCLQSEKLFLVYNPFDDEYYIDIEIESFSKKEINRLGYLDVQMRFKYLTPWYSYKNLEVESISEETYSYIQLSPTGEVGTGSTLDGPTDVLNPGISTKFSVLVRANGHFDSGFKFEYHGAANHPVFILEDASTHEEIGRCLIKYDFPDGSKIEYSTQYSDSHVESTNMLGESINLLPYLDLSNDPFFRIPVKKNSEGYIIKVQDDGAVNGILKCAVYDYYRSV